MKRTTIFIDEHHESDLRTIARRQKRPVAAVVREALESYISATKSEMKPRLGFSAIGRSGFSNTAETHEDWLWSGLDPHDGKVKAGNATTAQRARASRSSDTGKKSGRASQTMKRKR
jgi:predicted transcriptional regulator